MKELTQVSSLQLFYFWKKLSIGLLAIIALMVLSRVFPFYAAPIISTLVAAFLYTLLYTSRFNDDDGCNVSIYALFRCVINYTVATVALNLIELFNWVNLPNEVLFMTNPYIPSLMLHPICFFTVLIVYLRRNKLKICDNCKLRAGGIYDRGKTGRVFRHESIFLLRNLLMMFGVLSLLVWGYYIYLYLPMQVSSRDWYVYMWLTVIFFIIDEIYFIYRYYNLYLDFKENDEIISQEELRDMTARTYLKYYVICGNYIYLDAHSVVPGAEYREVYDTPFMTKRSVNGLPLPEVKNIIEHLTGVNDGELRFFYGRKSSEFKNRSVLRYFYFLDGQPADYTNMPTQGEWVEFSAVKRLYTQTPGRLSPMCLSDITRLATIVLTEKIFDENGYRKSKVKSYSPSFTLEDVRESNLDFQDDKWIKISLFNSDKPFYNLRRRYRMLGRKHSEGSNRWDSNL